MHVTHLSLLPSFSHSSPSTPLITPSSLTPYPFYKSFPV